MRQRPMNWRPTRLSGSAVALSRARVRSRGSFAGLDESVAAFLCGALGQTRVAAALAVSAGIPAADAICGLSLGQWSRGQDHAQAVNVLVEVALRDTRLPIKLRRLLADIDAAHYSLTLITVEKAKTMVRQAAALLAEADAL